MSDFFTIDQMTEEDINNFYKCTCIDESMGNCEKKILTLLSNLASYDKKYEKYFGNKKL